MIVMGIAFLFDAEIDRVLERRFSPDQRRVIEVVYRDHGYGLGLTEIYGVLRLRRAKGWGLGRWVEVLTVSEKDLEGLVEPLVGRDDAHVAVTFSTDTRVLPDRMMVMGVEVEIRRGRPADDAMRTSR